MTDDEKMKIFEDQVLKVSEALQEFFEEAAEKLTPVIDAVAKAASIVAEDAQDATESTEGMTNEEAASYFEEIIKCADWVDASYTDGVKVEAIRTAFKALRHREAVCCNPKEYAQDATEAAETHDFHEGELIVYQNGDTFAIGEIKRICDDGAFVWYHEGNTASKTPFENMHKLRNAYCITQTAFALDRPICDDDCEHCDFATCPKEE